MSVRTIYSRALARSIDSNSRSQRQRRLNEIAVGFSGRRKLFGRTDEGKEVAEEASRLRPNPQEQRARWKSHGQFR